MGACSFRTSSRGKTMEEAFKRAKSDAQYERGHDSYSGTIGSVDGFRDVTSLYKRKGASLNDFISDTIDEPSKWGPCYGICVEEPVSNNNKIKSQVIHKVSKGTKKWVLKYVVTSSSRREGEEIGAYDTKGEAVNAARNYTERTHCPTMISMEKRLMGEKRVAEVVYKKGSNEKDGLYVFYGMAPE